MIDDQAHYIAHIRASDLKIDRSYQPEDRFDENRAIRMAAEWDWARYQPLQVGLYADRQAYVIDGQHRRAAAMLVHGDDVLLPCYVVGQVTQQQAAMIFALADKNRKAVSVPHKFGALLVAKDPEALDIVETLRRYQWNVSLTNNVSSHAVSCVATLLRIYQDARGGPERLDQTMRVVTAAWGHTPKTASAVTIAGVSRFLKLFGSEPQFDEGHLIHRLAEVSVEELTGPEAGAVAVKLGIRVGDAKGNAVALAIRDRYNKRMAPRRRVGVTQDV